ncbi:ATP-binding cassette transporter [Volvox carteri f. nagariensis]|uniref:ATP-binding cassette transporter n=1 Tax=Volvox carteri f. nagariensis TaxID=3068 RepID=D8U9N6_VOLCA|nr:ATP-binding cassette transporter [Volvox carteri f. nagariensis]EFJ43615.1 ATP-binding cassette transporter [Volvox carteri f. nagariensis]|eukprot:XP_002955315.1 ATP-binding cassette transporter [Volvox carteri f. nagariensis]
MPGVEVRWNNLLIELEPPRRPLSQLLRKAVTALSSPPSTSNGAVKPARPSPSPTPTATQPCRPVILDAGSGCLTPGRMCLLLGPPGAGRTTLLKALAGQLIPPAHRSNSSRVRLPVTDQFRSSPNWNDGTAGGGGGGGGGGPGKAAASQPVVRAGRIVQHGTVLYNGLPVDGSAFEVSRAASYVGQTELHLPELTVAETLHFAAECQGQGGVERLRALLLKHEMDAGIAPDDPDLDLLLALARGPFAARAVVEILPACWVSTTSWTRWRDGCGALPGHADGGRWWRSCPLKSLNCWVTLLATLLQPSPDVVDCFHDVMLLSASKLLYHGPKEELLPYFRSMGLGPLPGQSLADFVQEVLASPQDQVKYRVARSTVPPSLPPPPPPMWAGRKWVSPRRMRKVFEASDVGREMAARLAEPPYTHPLQELALRKERYGTSTAKMWLATGFNFGPMYCNRLGVYYKQRDHRFYSPMSYALASVILRLPDVIVQAVSFSVMVYFSVGFTMETGRFFLFMFNMLLAGLNSITTFTLIASVMRSESATQGVGAVFLMVSTLVCGFPIAPGSIPSWWIWIYWLMPMSWNFRSLVVTEMTSRSWHPVEPSRTDGPTITVGLAALEMRGIPSDFKWAWVGLGMVAGMSVLQIVLQALALTYLGPLRASGSGPEHEHDDEHDMDDPTHLFLRQQQNLDGVGHLSSRRLETPPPAMTASAAVDVVLGATGDSLTSSSAGLPIQGPISGSGSGSGRNTAVGFSAPSSVPAATALANGNGSGSLLVRPPLPPSPASAAAAATALGAELTAPGGVGSVLLKTSGSGSSRAPAAWAASGAAAATATATATAAADDGNQVLAFRPVVMAFRNVSYFVKPSGEPLPLAHLLTDKKELQLLDRVSGVFRPGVLTSLMGASGAGKTTLMDVLAGRKTGGRVEGEQAVDGAPKRQSTFTRLTGYVEQVDVHNPHATVEEAMLFSARLRVSSDMLPAANARMFVRHMMKVVELGPLAHRLIGAGGASGGLSTEARKRLTIAVELVANPSIVFMDEPTTGLDARAAGLVMRAVRNTVATGRTVVCTIHQPNREIMDCFDELLLLKPGGRSIFFGPLGRRQSDLVTYLSSIPGVSGYEPHMNPAEWMLEVTSPAAEAALGLDFSAVWESSEQASHQ